MDLVDATLRCPLPEPRFAYVAPYFAQAKDVSWAYLKRFTAPIPGAVAHEAELRVDFPNGGRVRLYGADNYNRMRGIYLDGVVLDEPADFHPAAWPEVIRPRLSDRNGWAAFIGTPKGRSNEFYKIREIARTRDDWFHLELKASEAGILSADELAAAQRDMTPEQYAQEYECDFNAAITGAYYAKLIGELQSSSRIRSVPYDPNYKVFTSWDLGIHDLTCIWFVQIVGNEIRWIDYEESFSRSLIDSAKVVLSRNYLYEEHYGPHDIEVREMTSAKSRKETMEGVGLKPIRAGSSKVGPAERIHAMRQLLPRSVFDSEKCARGLAALINYQVAYDPKNRTPLDRPKHDWSSHASDAAGEMAVQLYERSGQRRQLVAHSSYDPFEASRPDFSDRMNGNVNPIPNVFSPPVLPHTSTWDPFS